MLVKDPNTRMIINKDDSHLIALQVRRKQKKEADSMKAQLEKLQATVMQMQAGLKEQNG